MLTVITASLSALTLLGCSLSPEAKPHEEVDQTRLMGYLRALPEARAPNGDARHVRGLIETEAWLRTTLEDMGYEVHQQRIVAFQPPEGVEVKDPAWHNLWVEIEGTVSPEQMMIVGAHFDAVPGSPGADDNGSGTAGALELARVFRGLEPERTIRIVFFNLEEIGLIGSRFHANTSIKPAIDAEELEVVGMMSLEMLGYYSDEEGSQRTPIKGIPGVFKPPTKGDFVAVVGLLRDQQTFVRPLASAMQAGAPDLKLLVFDMLPEPLPDMRRSDQDPFWRIGVPAVMLTDTSEFRTPHYHKASDRVDTIDAERFTNAIRGVAAGVWALANPSASEAVQAGED